MCPNYEAEGQGRGSTYRVVLLNKSLLPSHLKWPALYSADLGIGIVLDVVGVGVSILVGLSHLGLTVEVE